MRTVWQETFTPSPSFLLVKFKFITNHEHKEFLIINKYRLSNVTASASMVNPKKTPRMTPIPTTRNNPAISYTH